MGKRCGGGGWAGLIKNEVQEANRQLQQLPKDLIYGVNFNKDTEELSSIDREKEVVDNARLKEASEAEAKAKAKALEEARIKTEAADAAKMKKKTNTFGNRRCKSASY